MTLTDRRGADCGFTLVELLVGLALTAVAATLLMAAIGTSRSVAQRSERIAAGAESVTTAQALLRELIERLMADSSGADADSRRATLGDAGHFTFLAPPIGNRVGDGLARYFIALGRGGTLDLAAIDAGEVAGTATPWRILPLIDGVQAIEWSYYGLGPGGGERQWQAAWRDRDDPPELVRLRLRFSTGDPRSWADLVVRPETTVSTACDLDPTTGTCRAS